MINALHIEATAHTPLVVLDKETNIIEIKGYSFPDDAYGFYAEIVAWFNQYGKNPNAETTVVFELNYVNSTSVKYINDILKKLDDIFATGKNVKVIWHYSPDDDDIQDLGLELKDFHTVPFFISQN